MKKTLLLAVITIAISSCSIVQRKYMPGFYVNHSKNISSPIEKNLIEKKSSLNIYTKSTKTDIVIEPKLILSPTPDSSKCDQIIMQDGDILYGKVQKIGIDEIEYKACNNLNGPVIVIPKEDVFIIRYSNGTKTVFEKKEEVSKYTPPYKYQQEEKTEPLKMDGLATASMILGIVSLVTPIGSFLLALVAIIFGGVALKHINKKPEKITGVKRANAGIILGVIAIALWTAILAILYT